MYIKVKHETRVDSKFLIPLDDDFSLSIDLLSHYFPGTNSLKYMGGEVNFWRVMKVMDGRIWFDQNNWDPDIEYIAFRPIDSAAAAAAATAATPTPPLEHPTDTPPLERSTDTPPLTTRRGGYEYFKCLFIALFAAQTAVLLSVLATDFGSFLTASTRTALILKNVFFFASWLGLGIYSVQLVRDAIVDFFIKCCLK